MKHVSLDMIPSQGVSHNADIRKRVMLQAGDVPHLAQFAQAQFAPGQVAAAHAHADMHEVFLAVAGTGTLTVNGVPHALAPGVCVAVAPGETHEVCNTGSEPLVLTYFGILAGSSGAAA